MNASVPAQMLVRWNALSATVRLALAGAAVAIVAASVFVTALARAPRVPLFATPLHGEQLAEVEERLAEWNVAFTPTADNAVVDASRRNDVLLRLSLAGVPHAHVDGSAEALADVGVLTPPEVIDARTRAGLAGDIEAGLALGGRDRRRARHHRSGKTGRVCQRRPTRRPRERPRAPASWSASCRVRRSPVSAPSLPPASPASIRRA